MKIETSAPSNIALIKYMGKQQQGDNQPTNSSLSWTLNHLRTFVTLTEIDSSQDEWKPLINENFPELSLSEKSKNRYLAHFSYLKNHLHLQGSYLIQSGNNFPSDCGLASSASSFAALTKAACLLSPNPVDTEVMAKLSQKGSGSSCRSFFEPWALWQNGNLRELDFPVGKLLHQVVVVEAKKKLVSSSEAHQKVLTSELFFNRPERAEKRLAALLEAFKTNNWDQAFYLCWAEFWDMHALFETSQPPFGYFEEGSMQILRWIRDFWHVEKDGPLVTMDAGANVHFLYRADQANVAQSIRKELSSKFTLFGEGPKS